MTEATWLGAAKAAVILLSATFLPLAAMGAGKERADTISARRAFTEMAPGNLDLLPRDTRVDMLIYFDNDSIYSAVNNAGGKSRLQEVAPDYLSVSLTDASTLELKVLDRNDGSQIVMAVYTVGRPGEIQDSEVEFYDARMQPLQKDKIFRAPKTEAFLKETGKDRIRELESLLPFYAVAYDAAPGSATLTGRLTYGDLLPKEDQPRVEALLKPLLTFTWNGKEFKPTE